MRGQGVGLMLLSTLFFAAMASLVRGLESVNAYIVVVARFAVGVLLVGALFASGLDRLRWRLWGWIIGRGVSGGIAGLIYYWSIQQIGLAKGALLAYTYVIFGSILAGPFLGERFRPGHWLALAGAMVGIGLVCGVDRLSVGLAEIIALAGGLCSGFAVVCIARCREADSASNVFLSQCVFGLAIAAWPALAHWAWPTAPQWAILIAIGLLAALGQITMTHAYKFTGAAYGSLLSLLAPVLSALIGVVYFREPLSLGFLAGALLILGACAYLSVDPVARTAAVS